MFNNRFYVLQVNPMQTSTSTSMQMQTSQNNHQSPVITSMQKQTFANKLPVFIYLDIKLFIDQLHFSRSSLSWPSI